MFTTPVVITWPLSMLVTRVIGRKIARRPKHLDDQAEDPRAAARRADHRDQVAHPADLVTRGVEDLQAGQPAHEDAGGGGAHRARVVASTGRRSGGLADALGRRDVAVRSE